MEIIYLDTETTDLGPEARLVQLAYKNSVTGKIVSEFFKPPIPISCGAMSVHHITNEMVADKDNFCDSSHKTALAEELASNILVAHSAPFDVRILKNEGVVVGEYIDTLRLSKHLVDSEQYGLQYLRYYLKLDVAGMPHNAEGDINFVEALFNYLKSLIANNLELGTDEEVIQKMLELNKTPVLLKTFSFGKYRGKTFGEVGANDRGYLEWLYNSESRKTIAEQNEELIHTLKKNLRII